MLMMRVISHLQEEDAVQKLAGPERRDPPTQIALIFEHELERSDSLSAPHIPETAGPVPRDVQHDGCNSLEDVDTTPPDAGELWVDVLADCYVFLLRQRTVRSMALLTASGASEATDDGNIAAEAGAPHDQ